MNKKLFKEKKKLLFNYILLPLLFSLVFQGVYAQTVDTIILFPDGAPGKMGNLSQDNPQLLAFTPKKMNTAKSAVLICPGGGYRHLSETKEGSQIAQWFNTLGVTAFVLHYRINPYLYPHAFEDAVRAMQIIRSQSKMRGTDPDKTGVIGFSAGGHLASMLGTLNVNPLSLIKDTLNGFSTRPDFMALIYPLITLSDEYTDTASRTKLLGPHPNPRLIAQLSTENRVNPNTPPTFLVSTYDDRLAAENSLLFYIALRKAKVPAELHIFSKGGHGYGLYPKDNPALATWPDRLRDWLQGLGMLGNYQ